jgi:hypothetical protein
MKEKEYIYGEQVSYTSDATHHLSRSTFAGQSLQSLVESIVGEDVDKAHVSEVQFSIGIRSNDYPAYASAVLVQSSVSPSSGLVTLTEPFIIDDILDSLLSDVGGFRVVSQCFVDRLVPVWNGTSVVLYFNKSMNFRLSKDVINLLNKESESERLQELYLVIFVYCEENDVVMARSGWAKIKYKEVGKELVFR